MTSRLKPVAVRGVRRASSHRVVRRSAAAVLRRDPRRLFRFMELSVVPPFQIRDEFVPFLQLLASRPPTALLEIGTATGGSFFLMCQAAAPDAHLATLDLHSPSADLIRSFARGGQTVTPLEGDSRDPATRARIDGLFPDGVDVLFINGDHTLDGVTADFDAYETLLRPGGLVVFHDIVEDNGQRGGVPTGGWSGGVPEFWRGFEERMGATWEIREFVASWAQDGFGIGVATKPR